MLINIIFLIILLFFIIINVIYFLTTSGKQMVEEIENQQRPIGKIGFIATYLPALLVRITVNCFTRSYKKHKPIYEFIGEFIAISLILVSTFGWYILLCGFNMMY